MRLCGFYSELFMTINDTYKDNQRYQYNTHVSTEECWLAAWQRQQNIRMMMRKEKRNVKTTKLPIAHSQPDSNTNTFPISIYISFNHGRGSSPWNVDQPQVGGSSAIFVVYQKFIGNFQKLYGWYTINVAANATGRNTDKFQRERQGWWIWVERASLTHNHASLKSIFTEKCTDKSWPLPARAMGKCSFVDIAEMSDENSGSCAIAVCQLNKQTMWWGAIHQNRETTTLLTIRTTFVLNCIHETCANARDRVMSPTPNTQHPTHTLPTS